MTTPKIGRPQPGRIVVGPSYYLASGIIRSRTQFDRLRKSGRISLFNVGARLGQYQDVADAQLARLVSQPSEDNAA